MYEECYEEIIKGLKQNYKDYELYFALGEYYLTRNINQAYLCYENALFYCEDEKDKEYESSIGAWYSYYKGIESHVQLYEKNLLVYRIDYNEYTGGAHGIYMTTFLNMDLGLMRPLRLDDVFVGEYQEALTDLIWNQLMADNEAKTRAELEDMGYGSTGEIAPTENFYLDKDGVTFYYNVYDITPYAMGPVTVSIPFQMLEHMLGSNPVVGELKN